MTDKTARIRALNDTLRRTGRGGIIVATSGIAALGQTTINETFKAIKAFDAFTTDNDPHEEHDFGMVTVAGECIYWKIDYYNLTRDGHSPNASDPAVTQRVLTIMRAREY